MKTRYIIGIALVIWSVSCTITKKVKTGDEAYALKQYSVAVEMLEEEYDQLRNKEEKYRKAFYLGESYDILNRPDEAIRWYKKAVKHQPNATIRRKLAHAYKKNEQYQDAHDLFMVFYAEAYNPEDGKEIELCRQAMNQKASLKNYNINRFSVNTKYGEYSPVYLDEDHLVFTSDREESQGGDTYKWTGNSFSDLYVANINGRKVNNFDAIINTSANEGTACFSKDGNQIFFTRCESIDLRNQHCRIYFSHRPNGFWMEAEPLMFFSEKTNFAHPCLIENDSILVFSAAPETSDGTYDLYYSEKIDGGWSEPELMPSSINSLGNEKFPTSHEDTLYFSSDKLPGYGGYDIFSTVLGPDNRWSTPENMGIPINSGADDFGLAIDPKYRRNQGIELQGYFSSSRNVGTSDDIFFFTKYIDQETEEEEEEKEVVDTEIYNTYLSVRVVEIKYKDDDPNKAIVGKTPIKGAELRILADVSPGVEVVTDKSGRHTLQVLPSSSIKLVAKKTDYIANEKTISTLIYGPMTGDTTINVEVALDKIQYDKEIVLESIYYDYNRWEIRKDAKPSLDTLKTILDLNPELNIQLASHTDCRGEVDYNLNLSQKRAESAVNYLISTGIDATRLKAKGMGKSAVEINCNCDDCTEEQHQQNRRTTFKILRN